MHSLQPRSQTIVKITSFARILCVILLLSSSIVIAILVPFVPHSQAETSSSTGSSSPPSLTWESEFSLVGNNLDPTQIYGSPPGILWLNVYESLLGYDGTSSTQVIPWLAENYTLSPDGKTASFVLRNGINFSDGNPLNSTAVYFSLNRMFIQDNGAGDWALQQFANKSLSSFFCGCALNYTSTWANDVLGQNFVDITGPSTFKLNIQNPDASLPYVLSTVWTSIIDPQYVMSRDLALWEAASPNYYLPYRTLDGPLIAQINEYFHDEVATCTSSAPASCGNTYLEASLNGSLAGTGPYALQSVSANTTVLQARTNYWGCPYQFLGGSKIVPKIATINIQTVPLQTDRTRDLTKSASSGQAMTVDVDPNRLFDVANSSDWLKPAGQNKLVSTIPNVDLYGPFTSYFTRFFAFMTNVTDSATGTFYKFQPFADLRLRLAFTDAVDLAAINQKQNNNLGQPAINMIPPGLPPLGAYNSTILPRYAYNLQNVQNLLLSAMMDPITKFSFVNGTAAPSGLFNNTFGCTALNAKGQCDNPVGQTLKLTYYQNDQTVGGQILSGMANVVNNISNTYHMGLTVLVEQEPHLSGPGQVSSTGQAVLQDAFNGYLYFYDAGGWAADYPWVMDFLAPVFSGPYNVNTAPLLLFTPSGAYPNTWNLTQMSTLYKNAVRASQENNVSGLVSLSNQINTFANQQVLYYWTSYPYTFYAITSNVQGFFYNPSNGLLSEYYFASLSIGTPSGNSSSFNGLLLILLPIAAVASATIGGVFYARSRKRRREQLTLVPPALSPSEAPLLVESVIQGEDTNVQLALNAPKEVFVNTEFKIRFDLINTGSKPATLHKIEEILPSGLLLISKASDSGQQDGQMPLTIKEEDNVIHLHGKKLHPSQIESLTLTVKVTESGEIELGPKITYSDEHGKLFTRTLAHPMRFVVTRHRSPFKKWLTGQ